MSDKVKDCSAMLEMVDLFTAKKRIKELEEELETANKLNYILGKSGDDKIKQLEQQVTVLAEAIRDALVKFEYCEESSAISLLEHALTQAGLDKEEK